ncbi:MAG TPA: BtrH N-terminal domain-containing protein [Firmicutes bacterium]|nr:BtrH N-terminal domain-containing protein [Bacillota bacterium]
MTSVIENLSFCFGKSDDRRLRSLDTALRAEGISLETKDAALLSRSMRFQLFNCNTTGSYEVPILVGVDQHFFEQFISHSALPMEHKYGLSEKDDFQYIVSQIQSGHCVIIAADRFDLLRLMAPSIKQFGNRHIPLHTLLVYGVDTDAQRLLICETCSNYKKFYRLWVDAKQLFSARHNKCYDFEIQGDMYSFSGDIATKDVEFDRKQAALDQISILCKDLTEALPRLQDFCEEMKRISDNDTVVQRYYIGLFGLLKITLCGMDTSGYFYRSTLDRIVAPLMKNGMQLEMVRKIQKEWCDLSRVCKKIKGQPKDYQDIVQIWKKIEEIGRQEYSLLQQLM